MSHHEKPKEADPSGETGAEATPADMTAQGDMADTDEDARDEEEE